MEQSLIIIIMGSTLTQHGIKVVTIMGSALTQLWDQYYHNMV